VPLVSRGAVSRSDPRAVRAGAVVFMPLGRAPPGARFRVSGHVPITDCPPGTHRPGSRPGLANNRRDGRGWTGTASGGEGDRVNEGGEASVSYPKIELHVHLEGTVRAGTLLQIARRNGTALPADSVEGLTELYEFRDFAHFIETWVLTTGALRTEQDFRQVVVDYAAEAAAHGAVYLEGIFSSRRRGPGRTRARTAPASRRGQ
jgi:Adenosine deaminase